MTEFTQSITTAINYLLEAQLTDIVDMIIVAFFIYELIAIIRKTNMNSLARGIVIVLLALWASVGLRLTVVNFIIRGALEIGILALIILFQPELRRIFERVGSKNIFEFLRGRSDAAVMESAITQTVLACGTMSEEKTGALIVFERVISLDGQINTGTIINAAASVL